MIKCYEITPGGWFDKLIVRDSGQGWGTVLEHAETILDGQYSDDVKWDDIQLTIKCVYLTEEEFAELDTE